MISSSNRKLKELKQKDYLHMPTMFPNWKRPNSFGVEFMGKAFNIRVSLLAATCKSQNFLKTRGLYFFGKSCMITLSTKKHAQ